ncbi:hypothetical protein EV190_104165 [Actinorugispora endophytica]|uniref:Uncharacterized protein n=1 Tax=Actinorugispora endophytica TaxID=1605990 RepID=A0A4R6VA19_9ACTN|nr:hypothetical protein EV190_104165 [Actinorugispora endophytica]
MVRFPPGLQGSRKAMSILSVLLLILGIVLIVAGVMALLRKQMLWGIVLIVVGVILAPSSFVGF